MPQVSFEIPVNRFGHGGDTASIPVRDAKVILFDVFIT
jgi:hypothetical protein